MWLQVQADARASYQLYSKDVESAPAAGQSRLMRPWRMLRGIFWAMLMKLSPARRVLLLVAALLTFVPGFRIRSVNLFIDTNGLRLWAVPILFVLLALELADRVTMKRDLEIARDIQDWLMPSTPPQVAGADIAFRTRPANTVAGDYYDVFFRGDQQLLIVVADVAGKSVPAALLTATLQASLRTLAALPGSLQELVERVNRYACDQSVGGTRFTTAFLAELQPATGVLTYVNAGHNWPVLRRASGGIERLEAGGLPLGITKLRPYQTGTTKLASGDLLFIFTDGVVEAEDSREAEYGEARMLRSLGEFDGATAGEVLQRLMNSVDAFAGLTRQHDDMTCLALRKL